MVIVDNGVKHVEVFFTSQMTFLKKFFLLIITTQMCTNFIKNFTKLHRTTYNRKYNKLSSMEQSLKNNLLHKDHPR